MISVMIKVRAQEALKTGDTLFLMTLNETVFSIKNAGNILLILNESDDKLIINDELY